MGKILAFLMAFFSLLSSTLGAGVKLSVKETKLQTVSGFGTSAAWWAQMIGDEDARKEISKQLYSSEGLALNIYRYNVGGGSNPEKERIADISRRTESFLYFNEKSGEYEFDFSRDKNAQDMLFESLSYGNIDTVVLFANSPHYSMTKNGETIGSVPGECNIDSSRYQDFVDYFLTITEYFLEKGVPVKYISPINEPQWDWGSSEWVGQEGCHYSAKEAKALLKLFAKGIKQRSLPVSLMAPESGQIGGKHNDYISTLRADKELDSAIVSYAYHSYWEDEQISDKLEFGVFRNTVLKNRSVDMTEWCELPSKHEADDFEEALIMGRVMANDFNFENCNSWSTWVAVNGSTRADGLFYALKNDFSDAKPTARYAAMAHFSKFVPAGSKLLKLNSNTFKTTGKKMTDGYITLSSAAFLTPSGQRVIVVVNEGDAQSVKLSVKGSEMKIYTSNAFQSLALTYEGEKLTSIEIPEKSISTIVVG